MPKLSYLVSSYDSDEYLGRHISNLITDQTDPDFEIVVVVPDSPGQDAIIASAWEMKDSRVHFIDVGERESYGSSWLRAWKAAESPLVVNSNADDLHGPRFTEAFSEAMASQSFRSDKRIGFCYAGMCVVDSVGGVKGHGLKPEFDFEKHTYECWGGPQVCWLNDDEFNGMLDWQLMEERAAQHTSAFDYWLQLYFMSLGFHGHVIPEILTIYTQRQDSVENRSPKQNNYESFASISEFFPHHFQGRLKKHDEFADFNNLPPKDEWIDCMQRGKTWRSR